MHDPNVSTLKQRHTYRAITMTRRTVDLANAKAPVAYFYISLIKRSLKIFGIMMKYYPLAPGNKWEYKQKDGSVYTNAVTHIDGQVVTMQNSTVPDPSRVKVDNGVMYNELMAPGNFQPWLRDDLQKGDTWEAVFTANGLKSIMEFSVKEAGISKEMEGKTYPDVIMLEAESKIDMNGNRISTNFFTQYYYAKGVGLIMTTSSLGDVHALKKYVLN